MAVVTQTPTGDRHAELLEELLLKTSRTFALNIPLLPQPTRREVVLAYLLFRIADTFEDASVFWSNARQQEALAEFSRLLRNPSRAAAEELARVWLEERPSDHEGYLELLRETPAVLESFQALQPRARDIIADHTIRTAELMSRFVGRSSENGELRLEDVADLRAYCYAVAGIVGEVLTELFLFEWPDLGPVGDYLRERAVAFGEGLQLVNILKDSESDALEGRFYLPAGVDRSEVLALARRDLDRAAEYAAAIQRAGGPDGIVGFTALPVELARATLDRVEAEGPGAKITRGEVFEIVERVQRAIDEGRLAAPV